MDVISTPVGLVSVTPSQASAPSTQDQGAKSPHIFAMAASCSPVVCTTVNAASRAWQAAGHCVNLRPRHSTQHENAATPTRRGYDEEAAVSVTAARGTEMARGTPPPQ